MSVDPGSGGVVAVLFDLDGTLLDHEGAVGEALRMWLPSTGLTIDEGFRDRWLLAEQRHLADWRAGRISWAEQRRRRLREVVPAEVVGTTDEAADALFAGYLRAYESAWQVFEDVHAVLDVLERRRVRLGVLTNGTIAQQQAKLAAVGLIDRFEFVLTAEELGAAKPDPVVFLAACDRFDLRPSHVLHVGDLPDLDVEAAAAAGLHAVLIDRTDRHQRTGSLRSLGALPDHLTALNQQGLHLRADHPSQAAVQP